MGGGGRGVLILVHYFYLEVCHLFPYNNYNFRLIRGGVVKYNLRPLPPSLSFSYAFASNYCKQFVFHDNVNSFCMPKTIFPIRLASNDKVDLTSFGQTSVFVSNCRTIKNWLMASLISSIILRKLIFKRLRIYESHIFELRIKTWTKVILAVMCTT